MEGIFRECFKEKFYAENLPNRKFGGTFLIDFQRNGLWLQFQFFENVRQALVNHFLFVTKFIQTFIFVKPSFIRLVPQNCSTGSTRY